MDHYAQARSIVHELTLEEKLWLLNDLTQQVIQQSHAATPRVDNRSLPSHHLEKWPDDLSLRREDMYNEYGR